MPSLAFCAEKNRRLLPLLNHNHYNAAFPLAGKAALYYNEKNFGALEGVHMETYDLVIVGAGPAGSTLARLAGRERRVLLLDGARREKPCGGLLAPDAQKALARFDLTLPKEVLVDPQIFAVRTIDLKTRQQRYYQRMYINVDRAKFDRWLLGLIPDTVEVRTARCTGICRQDDGFTITFAEHGESPVTVHARTVVGADGAGSLVRRTLFGPGKIRRYVSIQQWFPLSSVNPFYSCVFDPLTSPCCSWSICKDNHFIFGGAFPGKNCMAAFELQKQRLAKYLGMDFGTPEKTEACQVLRPHRPASFCLGGGGAYLIGEAAGLISPSSLEGISSAILSATALADSLESRNPLSTYRGKTRSLRWHLLAKNLKCPFMYNPFLRRLVLKSGLTSIPVDGQR